MKRPGLPMMITVGGLNSLRAHQEARGPPETSAALVLGDIWAPTGAASCRRLAGKYNFNPRHN